MSGPRITSGKDSQQVVGTPWQFIHALEKRWGKISVDLAAAAENSKGQIFISKERDSFTVDWHKLSGNLWLNPEFGNIAPWARKCADEKARGAKIFFLVPASIDSNWWSEYVHGQACVLPLHPRLKFEGHEDLYPKTLALCVYGIEPVGYPGRWVWKESTRNNVQHKSQLQML